MTFKDDILVFLNNTLIKLEKIESIIFKQEEEIKNLKTKIKEYEIKQEKLDRADEILETAKINADIIINSSLTEVGDKEKGTK